MYLFIVQNKTKQKQNPYKIRKIKEKKRKLLVFKASHNNHHQPLLMKKKNMKWKKLESIGNEIERCNISCIEKVMGMSMTNGLQNQDCLMQKR